MASNRVSGCSGCIISYFPFLHPLQSHLIKFGNVKYVSSSLTWRLSCSQRWDCAPALTHTLLRTWQNEHHHDDANFRRGFHRDILYEFSASRVLIMLPQRPPLKRQQASQMPRLVWLRSVIEQAAGVANPIECQLFYHLSLLRSVAYTSSHSTTKQGLAVANRSKKLRPSKLNEPPHSVF